MGGLSKDTADTEPAWDACAFLTVPTTRSLNGKPRDAKSYDPTGSAMRPLPRRTVSRISSMMLLPALCRQWLVLPMPRGGITKLVIHVPRSISTERMTGRRDLPAICSGCSLARPDRPKRAWSGWCNEAMERSEQRQHAVPTGLSQILNHWLMLRRSKRGPMSIFLTMGQHHSAEGPEHHAQPSIRFRPQARDVTHIFRPLGPPAYGIVLQDCAFHIRPFAANARRPAI